MGNLTSSHIVGTRGNGLEARRLDKGRALFVDENGELREDDYNAWIEEEKQKVADLAYLGHQLDAQNELEVDERSARKAGEKMLKIKANLDAEQKKLKQLNMKKDRVTRVIAALTEEHSSEERRAEKRSADADMAIGNHYVRKAAGRDSSSDEDASRLEVEAEYLADVSEDTKAARLNLERQLKKRKNELSSIQTKIHVMDIKVAKLRLELDAKRRVNAKFHAVVRGAARDEAFLKKKVAEASKVADPEVSGEPTADKKCEEEALVKGAEAEPLREVEEQMERKKVLCAALSKYSSMLSTGTAIA